MLQSYEEVVRGISGVVLGVWSAIGHRRAHGSVHRTERGSGQRALSFGRKSDNSVVIVSPSASRGIDPVRHLRGVHRHRPASRGGQRVPLPHPRRPPARSSPLWKEIRQGLASSAWRRTICRRSPRSASTWSSARGSPPSCTGRPQPPPARTLPLGTRPTPSTSAGRGLNSGLASATSLARSLSRAWQGKPLRDADFIRHEAAMPCSSTGEGLERHGDHRRPGRHPRHQGHHRAQRGSGRRRRGRERPGRAAGCMAEDPRPARGSLVAGSRTRNSADLPLHRPHHPPHPAGERRRAAPLSSAARRPTSTSSTSRTPRSSYPARRTPRALQPQACKLSRGADPSAFGAVLLLLTSQEGASGTLGGMDDPVARVSASTTSCTFAENHCEQVGSWNTWK
ncbi:hypothetical protein SAVIM40S_07215 [Streptomyces avidinii]